MYVLIRNDIPRSYQAVQAGHAVAQYVMKHFEYTQVNWNLTLVYLNVKGEPALDEWEYDLKKLGINFETFVEPDIGNQKTAIAILTDKKEVFKRLKLM